MRPPETNRAIACLASLSNGSVNSGQSHHWAMPSTVSLACGEVSRYRRIAHAVSQIPAADAFSTSTAVHHFDATPSGIAYGNRRQGGESGTQVLARSGMFSIPRNWTRPPITRKTSHCFRLYVPRRSDILQSAEHEREHVRAPTFLRAGRLPFGKLGFQPGIGTDSTCHNGKCRAARPALGGQSCCVDPSAAALA